MLTTTFILLTATLPLSALDDAGADLQAQVRKLVRQLGSAQVAERDAAETALVELGPPALDVVEKFIPHPDAEINSRLLRVQETLYKQAVEAATAATTVTLDVDAKPLSEVLAMIEEQTGNRIVDKREDFGHVADDPKITLDIADVPYWKALDEVLDEAELTTYNFTGEKSATAIISRPLGHMPRTDMAGYSGVFRFEPTQVEAIRDLRNPSNRVLKLFVEVSWEPRLSPITVSQSLDTLTLTDEDGNELEAARGGAIAADINSSIAATDLEFPLILPSRDVEKIAKLQGELAVLVPGRVEKFTFDKIDEADDTEQKKASATVILQTVRKNNAIHEVRMVLRFDKAANALESHRGWVLNNEAYLLDKDGNRVDHAGYETTRQTTNEVGFGYKFVVEGDIGDYQFVYHTPAAVVQKTIEYELRDIPLP